jgi:aryl-alcohol dehydrogenase-like predicted oxidoreductase
MEYVRFGNTGMKVSRICLGCMSYGRPNERWPWALNEEQSRPFIKKALDLGINFFDTADIYSFGASEEIVGRAIRDMVPRREEVVIATKVNGVMGPGQNDGGLSRKHLLSAIDASLTRLGMDYVDVYQIHRWDYETPIEETLEALNDIVRMGKARYIGASSMFAWQFAKALYLSDQHGWSRFISMQPHYNLLYREEEREMLPLCRDQKIAVIPWSPLARGMLTRDPAQTPESERSKSDAFGKNLYTRKDDFSIAKQVNEIAQARGIPNAQVALAWMLDKEAITAPIIGATQLKHLEDAVAALEVHLSQEETRKLEETYQPHNVSGFA